ncbi:MAG: phosphatidylserine decarboxylase [Lachnospiraceae bacterium]
MKDSSLMVRFLYKSAVGRFLLKIIMKFHLDHLIVRFLCSPLSKPVIYLYVKYNNIPMTKDDLKLFDSFRDFFRRKKTALSFDNMPSHLISPCDGWLSAFPIDEKSCFSIKNSHYCVSDFLQDTELAKNYLGGICLIFRLCVSDYHHYYYIDDGYQGENHFIPGVLHSVQPIAYETYPVFVLNKRSWCLLTTEHFGPVVQCEIGALVVGGIFNEKENSRFSKGMEKGHFELAGSTIILLFEKEQMQLRPELLYKLSLVEDIQVKYGEWIGTSERSKSYEARYFS